MNVSNNLKSNFFDKMLSNEMLSIKQHIYEKDSSYGSTVYLTFRNSVQTPTLVIKQKWLLEKPLIKQARKKHENFTSFPFGINKVKSRKKGVEHEKRNLADIQNKVMNEENFPPILFTTTHNPPKSTHVNHCSYKKSCVPTTCSRHKSEKLEVNAVKICSHTTRADCTRTSEIKPISITYYPYYVYSPYFMGVTNDYAYNTYETHTETEKPYNYDLYLEEDDELRNDESDYKINAVKGKYDEKNYKKDSKMYSIKYDDHDDTTDAIDLSKKLGKSYLKIVNRDEFVSEVVEDLKDYYNDVIIKDCYCSCFEKSRSSILHFVFIGICNVMLCFVNSI